MSNRCKILLPSSGVVDMYDEEGVSLTYQIADIKDPQKRHADYSKTITIPGTHNNNKLLCGIFEIGIDRYFNPNKKSSCILTIDTTPVLKGYMRLKNIINNDGKIDYEIEITGRLADLFTVLGDAKLRDLDWSDLNHAYTRANQIASWGGTIGSNYVYPFIDYGFTTNEIDYEVNHFFPAVYFKEIWERIMSWAGFQVSSSTNFFTSTPFKNLILPFCSDKMRLTAAQIDARRFQASRSTSVYYTQSLSATYLYTDIVFNDDSTSPNQDTGGVYNTSTGIWTCGASGYYTVGTNINLRTRVTVSAAVAGSYIELDVIFRIIDITNATPQVNSYSQLQVMNTNTTATGTTYYPFTTTFAPTSGGAVFVSAGTQVKVQAMIKSIQYGTATVTNFGIEIDPNSTFFTKVESELKEGDTVTMANVLPDMKMADFVNGVIKAFNIYTEYDKDVPNKILMNPRNSFYGSTVVDWTKKRDLSRDLEIIPMGALQARYYLFTYKEDKDYYNSKYISENGEIYGQKKITVDNDFLKNTNKEELPFSPTPLDSSSGQALNVPIVSNNDRYFPKIINVDQQGKVSARVSNPRMLYYGGVKPCKPWNYKSGITTSSGVTNYPYCGHFDDPITPTIDLNFGLIREVYYDPAFNATITDNNLYNVYWKQEIDEITDVNSSIVTGWFKLTPADINVLDFRNVFRFDLQNFRLNKIYDYNPISDGLTKCEFIKIKNGIPFVAASKNLVGASDDIMGGTLVPKVKPKAKPNHNLSGGTIGNTIGGSFNTVPISAKGVFIMGDYNTVGENAQNISIVNSSGVTVVGGLKNVTVVNSSGVTVTEDNTYVLNNVVVFSPSTGNANNIWTLDGSEIYHNHPTGDPVTRITRGDNLPGNQVTLRLGTNNATYKNYSAYLRAIQGSGIDRWEWSFGTSAGALATEKLRLTESGNLYGTALHNNSTAPTGTTNQYIASGTYTPTHSDYTNISASTSYLAQWIRVGNVVTVSGYFEADAVTAGGTVTSFLMTLPIASTFSSVTLGLGGSGACNAGGGAAITIYSDGASKASLNWFASSASNVSHSFTFTYLIL